MSDTTIRNEITDRIAIRELIDHYGYFADRLEADKQAALFLEEGSIEVYRGEPSATTEPVALLKGQKALADAFRTLKQYDLTFHFNGQNSLQLGSDPATGIVHCLVHHFFMENSKRMMLVMGIHYYDTYAYHNHQWFFASRKLVIDWQDKRESEAGAM